MGNVDHFLIADQLDTTTQFGDGKEVTCGSGVRGRATESRGAGGNERDRARKGLGRRPVPINCCFAMLCQLRAIAPSLSQQMRAAA